SQAGNANYNAATPVSQNLIVSPKPLTGSFTASSKSYDGSNTAVIASRTLTGVVSGDAANVSLSGGVATFTNANAGNSKTVTATGMSLTGTGATNYTLTTVTTATANITPRNISVLAVSKSKIYGDTDPALSYTFSPALVTGDNFSGNLSRSVGENVGSYAILQNTLSLNANYAILYTTADLIVARKALVITAENKTRNFGEANPPFTASYNGFIGNETVTVLTSPVVLSSSATVSSPAGNYPITASGASATNYTITYVAGILNIGGTSQQITFATLPGKLSTDPIFTLNASASSGLAVSYTSSDPTIARIINGNQVEILNEGRTTITANQSGNANYTAALPVSQNLVITDNPLPLISIVSSKGSSIAKGETIQLTASGAVNYQWSLTGSGIISGQSTPTLTIRPSVSSSYTVTGTNQFGRSATLTIRIEVKSDYSVLNATNILTPNGDGVNDVWTVENIDLYPDNTVRIFDKAGKVVFSVKGYQNNWAGTFNGGNLTEGTYYYIIDFGQGIGVKKGYITIVR
ncbi:MBG domain-containing protein, partial [Pedobacter agri]|uniref:MBG domain-containing protein n=1 Tax=Pedobacter agri TaxID=454586 RepID=UPI00292F9D17